MAKYLYQPLNIKFKSEMINDMNQHFCEGWSIDGLDLSNKELLNRVLQGKKPMAVIDEWEKSNLEIYDKLVDKNLFHISNPIKYEKTRAHYIIVAVKGKLKDLFDLNILYETYLENGISIDIDTYKDMSLDNFYYNWDDVALWVTGLILGYPIENTISIYKRDVTR